MEEIWKDIKDYEGLYQVSNLGRVKSLNYNHTGKEKILKLHDTHGYYRAYLCNKGKQFKIFVHRLVAQAFIPNPNNLPQVNHKDFNRKNNCSKNLEWITLKENVQYSQATQIKCLDLKTNETTFYPSIKEAARQLNKNSKGIWDSIYRWSTPYHKRYIFEEIKRARN